MIKLSQIFRMKKMDFQVSNPDEVPIIVLAQVDPLVSRDLPTLASQSAGITGMSHRPQPYLLFFMSPKLSFLPPFNPSVVYSW